MRYARRKLPQRPQFRRNFNLILEPGARARVAQGHQRTQRFTLAFNELDTHRQARRFGLWPHLNRSPGQRLAIPKGLVQELVERAAAGENFGSGPMNQIVGAAFKEPCDRGGGQHHPILLVEEQHAVREVSE